MARRQRRGAIVVITAVLLVVMVAMIAFALDIGVISVSRTELQNAADAAALAGVARLPLGEASANATSQEFVGRNLQVTGTPQVITTAGQWNALTRQFEPGVSPFDAFQVQVNASNQSLFFGRALGTNSFNAGASATAIVRPRDMVLVLDYSGSMLDNDKIRQLKQSVSLFLDVLDDNSTQDRVGFVAYSTEATLESGLTSNLGQVNSDVQTRPAEGWTNIGDGMRLGRRELTQDARSGATQMMILMTDGLANLPENVDPKQYVLDEADAAVAAGIDLVTIAFGSDSDRSLMQQVADKGDDPFFPVAGTMAECEQDLRAVFVRIATRFKVKLVQ